MSVDEKQSLNQLPGDKPNADNQSDAGPPPSNIGTALPKATELKMAKMLDHANNRLQELMQIFYLLSRDMAVPKDARAHVTVAQGEIERLVRAMRDSAEPKPQATAEPKTQPALKAFRTAHS